MKKRVLVDITAATEYAKKMAEEEFNKMAQNKMDEYNITHKRQIKNASVDDLNVIFDGLRFGYSYYVNAYKYGDAGSFTVPIDKFIVNVDEE